MRRGRLNKISILLITLSAIFTIISYIADQLIINNENKIRIIDSDIQKSESELLNLEKLEKNIQNLTVDYTTNTLSKLSHNNLAVKHMILYEAEKSLGRNNLKVSDWSIKNIKLREQKNMRLFMLNIGDTAYDHETLFNYNSKILKKIKNIDEFSFFDDLLNSENFYNLRSEKFFNKNLDTLFDKIYVDNRLLKKEDIIDFRNLKLSYIEYFKNKMNIIYDVEEKVSDMAIEKENEIYNLYKSKYLKSRNITYFVLTGILSQILTLLSLLFLFKRLVLRK
tara:strand:+ start:132 stop:971 length:840 start_codon:yes stop_codon:yes gene_type:complete